MLNIVIFFPHVEKKEEENIEERKKGKKEGRKKEKNKGENKVAFIFQSGNVSFRYPWKSSQGYLRFLYEYLT